MLIRTYKDYKEAKEGVSELINEINAKVKLYKQKYYLPMLDNQKQVLFNKIVQVNKHSSALEITFLIKKSKNKSFEDLNIEINNESFLGQFKEVIAYLKLQYDYEVIKDLSDVLSTIVSKSKKYSSFYNSEEVCKLIDQLELKQYLKEKSDDPEKIELYVILNTLELIFNLIKGQKKNSGLFEGENKKNISDICILLKALSCKLDIIESENIRKGNYTNALISYMESLDFGILKSI